ncbi:PREDICTED: nuclear GTPase SLIP-GC-like [Gekko japonicus]|uniref:Nuclear GTPase SLIP-GC-like n=1 Tax=Gekko japonicus TaxID=146911 RepID=A0ABM1KA94_GEKJA|nr:PREDICTED: nuclear GTPase SLIP-GC-like [Gekko japonicus]XP_015270631.1 PREDICTED: nuclear GTPase SLIP-GC-like [Gekko japonicus]
MASENPSTSEQGEMQMPLNCPGGAEGGSSRETPRKRKKISNSYQGFGLVEKDRLKKYEKWESKARKIVKETYDKLVEDLSQDDTENEINYLKNRLSTLTEKTSLDPIHIGCFGRTGAGKTSLLNAVLGKKLFLPVSGDSTCTACVIQIKTKKAGPYEGTIHLLSDDDWKEELKNLVEILSKNGSDEDDDDDDDCVKDAIKKLHALYGEGAEEKDYETLLKTKLQVTIPAKRKISIKAQEAEELSCELDPYLRVGTEGTNKLWPLISYAEVTIPGSDMPPEGVVLLDVPGTGDFNKKRDEMWKQSINTCSVIWIISDIERVQGEKIQAKLLEESIKAFPGGICTDVAMVVTKSDKMDLEEYRRERKNSNFSVKNEHDAILERNENVKDMKHKVIKEKLQKKLPPDSEVLNKPKLVYTISAREFWDTKHLSKKETEIPELREYIRRLYLKENQKLVTDYVTEVLSFLKMAKNFGSEVFQTSNVKELMTKEFDSLEEHLEFVFTEIEHALCAGVDNARKKYKKSVEKLLTGCRGYHHKTLKAVCLRDGVYASKNLARIDFNESLADPIYDKIDRIFGSIFRTEKATRSNLWSQLEVFKNEVQNKIRQTEKDNSKIEIFIQETNVILQQLKKRILQGKLDIYPSLSLSIQSDLKPHYKEASKVKGQGSYERMKTILTEGIEKEVTNQMFERAKSKMKSQFRKLKEDILQNLKGQISTAFSLVFLQQERVAVHLADIEKECREIEEIYNELQNDN